MRALLGIVVGILAGVLVQAGVVYLASLVVEVPAIRSSVHEEMARAFAASPPAALLANLVSYFAAALTAAWIAGAIGRRDWAAWVAGGVIAAMALLVALVFPEPAWAQFGAFAAALLGAFLGKRAAGGRTLSAPAADA